MAVMLQRYVEKVAKEELPQENAILEFTDASSIAVYAKDAVARNADGRHHEWHFRRRQLSFCA